MIKFLHGFLGSPLDWQGVIDALPLGYTPKKRVIVGYSMGGRIAMSLQQEADFLVLIAAHPGLETEEEKMQRHLFENHWLSLLDQEPLESFLTKWYAQPLFGNIPIPSARFFLDKEEVRRTFIEFSLIKQPSYWNTLTLPFLYIVGEKDTKYRRIAVKLRELYPHSHFAIVEGAAHAVHLEKPQEVAHLIKQALVGIAH